MIIGSNHHSVRPQRGDKGVAKGETAAPQDVLEVVQHNTVPQVVRASLQMGAKGLLRLGLPALALGLTGPVGMLAGLCVSTASQYLSSSGPGRLKNTLMVAGLSGALALAGLALAPLTGVAVAGIGLASLATGAAVLAGAKKQLAQEPTVTIQPQAFAERYLAKVRGENDPSLRGATAKRCADAVLQTAQWACTNLPAGAALRLAGETAQELLTPADLARFDQALLQVVDQKGRVYEGRRPLEGSQGLIEVDTVGPSPAFAANQVVLLDRKFEQKTDPVTKDFVLGHELSHIRHKDAAFKQGVKTLQAMLALASAPGNQVALTLVKLIFDGMLADESRQMELRADREGRDYALQQGHSPESIEKAARKLFAQAPETAGLFDGHPPGPQRIDALTAKVHPTWSLAPVRVSGVRRRTRRHDGNA